MAQYTGLNGTVYILGEKGKSGGEGVTYRVQNDSSLIAKLYKGNVSPEESAERIEKLRLMIGMKVKPTLHGHMVLAWPQDILHDPSTGKAVGFVMPLAGADCKSLVVAARPSERAGLYGPKYEFKYSVATAYNLAMIVDGLHNAKIVIGDLNAKNILVHGSTKITMIDCDSMQIVSPSGKLFKCSVGLPETEPPEIQGKDLRKPDVQFSVYTDRFALAIHIFTLLCDGFHPFNVLKPSADGNSVMMGTQTINISRGYCPFVHPHSMSDLPAGAPDVSALPDYIMDLFRRAFGYDAATAVRQSTIQNRPTAKEWADALKTLYVSLTQSEQGAKPSGETAIAQRETVSRPAPVRASQSKSSSGDGVSLFWILLGGLLGAVLGGCGGSVLLGVVGGVVGMFCGPLVGRVLAWAGNALFSPWGILLVVAIGLFLLFRG